MEIKILIINKCSIKVAGIANILTNPSFGVLNIAHILLNISIII